LYPILDISGAGQEDISLGDPVASEKEASPVSFIGVISFSSITFIKITWQECIPAKSQAENR